MWIIRRAFSSGKSWQFDSESFCATKMCISTDTCSVGAVMSYLVYFCSYHIIRHHIYHLLTFHIWFFFKNIYSHFHMVAVNLGYNRRPSRQQCMTFDSKLKPMSHIAVRVMCARLDKQQLALSTMSGGTDETGDTCYNCPPFNVEQQEASFLWLEPLEPWRVMNKVGFFFTVFVALGIVTTREHTHRKTLYLVKVSW